MIGTQFLKKLNRTKTKLRELTQNVRKLQIILTPKYKPI
jgi:hypothetical protein